MRQNKDKRVSREGLLGGDTLEDERRYKERDVSEKVGKTVKQDKHNHRKPSRRRGRGRSSFNFGSKMADAIHE